MSTHNIGFYEDLTKIIFQLLSNIIKDAISLQMKHNLEMFHEVREIMHKNDIAKMHKIMENC